MARGTRSVVAGPIERVAWFLPLILTLAWFYCGAWLAAGGRRGAGPVLGGFLLAELGRYFLHSSSGSLLTDLLLSDPIGLVSAMLDYLGAIVAVCYLIALLHRGAASRPSGDSIDRYARR